MTIKRIFGISTVLLLVVVAYLFFDVSQSLEKARSEDPLVWASDIETFAERGLASPNPFVCEVPASDSGVSLPRT